MTRNVEGLEEYKDKSLRRGGIRFSGLDGKIKMCSVTNIISIPHFILH